MNNKNLIAWKSFELPTDVPKFYKIAFGNGLFVATIYDSVNYAMYSNDGINWTKSGSLGTSSNWRVKFCNGMFFLMATSIIRTTEDMQTFGTIFLSNTTSNDTFDDIAYGNSIYVIPDNNIGSPRKAYTYVSANGTNFEKHELPFDSIRPTMVFFKGKYYLFNYENQFIASSDGVNWTIGSLPNDIERFVVNGNEVVGVRALNNEIYVTTDFINWNTYEKEPYSADYSYIFYCDNKYILTDDLSDSNTMASYNHIDWDVNNLPQDTIIGIRDMAFGNDTIVAVANNNTSTYYVAKTNKYNFQYINTEGGTITANVNNGQIPNGYEISLTATPDDVSTTFNGWYEDGELISSDNPYTFEIEKNTTIEARYTFPPRFYINAKSNVKGNNVWQSAKYGYEGDTITIRAREITGYKFSKWGDNTTNNPKEIVLGSEDVTVEAIYTKIIEDSTIYDWYAYIKDQTALNTPPKALIRVESFKVANDLLTTANSTIKVFEIPSDVNLGDILCLYNPKGIVRYYGIIKSITDKTIQCSQMQTFYKGKWLQENHYASETIESEIAYILERFAHGYMKGSDYQDMLQYQEKAPLKIKTGSSTEGNLTSPETNKVVDMETYIYELYQNYQIMLEFNIPYGSWTIGDVNGGSVTIKKPNYSSIKIGDNTNAIFDIEPTTKTEKTNKLIIYSKDGTYKTTFVTTTNGIVEEPSSIVGRFEDIDTKIVFSDDDEQDIVKANLSEDMFNHKISFSLLLDNNLYKYDDFKLGMPIDVFNGVDYYSSVITGIEISKSANQNVIEAKFTCGFSRTSLTKKLSRKLGVV